MKGDIRFGNSVNLIKIKNPVLHTAPPKKEWILSIKYIPLHPLNVQQSKVLRFN